MSPTLSGAENTPETKGKPPFSIRVIRTIHDCDAKQPHSVQLSAPTGTNPVVYQVTFTASPGRDTVAELRSNPSEIPKDAFIKQTNGKFVARVRIEDPGATRCWTIVADQPPDNFSWTQLATHPIACP